MTTPVASRRRVLIADDNAAVLDTLGRLLTQWGYEPVLARDGAEAWEVIQADDAPRVAILDWGMPRMDGLEVCRRARKLPPFQVPYLILLTGRDGGDAAIAGLEGGADEYVTKSVPPDQMRARLQAVWRLVDRHEQLANLARQLHESSEDSLAVQKTLHLCAAAMAETLALPDVPRYLRAALRTCRGLCLEEAGQGGARVP